MFTQGQYPTQLQAGSDTAAYQAYLNYLNSQYQPVQSGQGLSSFIQYPVQNQPNTYGAPPAAGLVSGAGDVFSALYPAGLAGKG